MQSSMPTTQTNVHEKINNLYRPSNLMPPGYQPYSSPTVMSQVQNGQQPFIISGMLPNSHLVQGNIQTVSPITGTESGSFNTGAVALGAIQIVIGLFHIGLGILLGFLCTMYNGFMVLHSLTFFGGYPFWGGLSFIIAGALSISAVKQRNICLIRGSLAMNIVSCFFILSGVILLLVDVSTNGSYYQNYWAVLAGRGILGMLAILSVVEFIINCITAHLANQVVCTNQPVLVTTAITLANPMTVGSPYGPSISDTPPAYGTRS